MRIILNGAQGRMGSEVAKLALEGYRGSSLVAGVDIRESEAGYPTYVKLSDVVEDADCLIDFSFHGSAPEVAEFCVGRSLPAVIATTGQSDEELEIIREAAKKIPIFMSANMSTGVALLIELAKTAVKNMPDADIEIIEKHHNRKADAPSGTALMLAHAIKSIRENARFVIGRNGKTPRQSDEVGIHSVRLGNIIGEHEVIIGTDSQTITLKHEAHGRALFAEGAIAAAEFVIGKAPGLYTMNDMIKA